MVNYYKVLPLILLSVLSHKLWAGELKVGKVCPVTYQKESIGRLIFSKPWYHSSRSNAKYIPGDNATGIGLEIHLKNNFNGKTDGLNLADCDRYRLLQIRKTNAKLHQGERGIQIDIPNEAENPFYDNAPLEHGRGLHKTPKDDADKPWQGRFFRDASVSIYDTPYVSDSYGVEGKDLEVDFETCAICERDQHYDLVLSCGTWGYKREYMGGMTGWAEPEFKGVQCSSSASQLFQTTINNSNRVEYSYWIHWR
ncbi:hypothetical protein [Neptuniibacter marinus]|uniref:hypothetical protein n=1 Tax=Neptuniibacter marinus TaxID=1806670 RepID=UPI00082D6CA1|nr:hypothetical protein [Neptuniibacter marinus]